MIQKIKTSVCPACDWKTKIKSNIIDGKEYFFVICADCGLGQNRKKFLSDLEAAAAWNHSCKRMREQ